MKIRKFNESVNNNAEDFLKSYTAVSFEDSPSTTGVAYEREDVIDAMIKFAKFHVGKALERAHSNMQLPEEDLDFTRNSYPLNSIK